MTSLFQVQDSIFANSSDSEFINTLVRVSHEVINKQALSHPIKISLRCKQARSYRGFLGVLILKNPRTSRRSNCSLKSLLFSWLLSFQVLMMFVIILLYVSKCVYGRFSFKILHKGDTLNPIRDTLRDKPLPSPRKRHRCRNLNALRHRMQ